MPLSLTGCLAGYDFLPAAVPFRGNVVTLRADMHTEISDKKIAVLLSGGVDSSVVVYELASRGLHPDCFYIKIGPEEEA